jgi:predicted  nucleic acid-binding Zn-ribbon protein
MNPRKTEAQQYAALVERFEALRDQKVRLETQLDSARQKVAQLQKQALEQFGTSDLSALRDRLAEVKRENEHRRTEYAKLLESIEQGVKQASQAYEATDASASRGSVRRGI